MHNADATHRTAQGSIRLLGRAVSLVWRSGRRESLLLIVLTLLQAAATTGQVVLIGELVDAVQQLSEGSGRSLQSVVPTIGLFSGLFVLQGVAGVGLTEVRVVLGELSVRTSQQEIAGTASAVQLIEFDRPDFHDLLSRATQNGATKPLQVVSGLTTIATAGTLCIALTVTLVLIQPLVLVLLLIGGVPAVVLTKAVTRETYRFAVAQTARDRVRSYLMYLLTARVSAAEVRAFDLADGLAARHAREWESRLAALRQTALRRSRLAVGSRLVNGLVSAGVIAVLVWTVARGRAGLAEATTAAAAMAILGARLNAFVQGLGVLYECALFLSDVRAFEDLRPVTTTHRAPAMPLRGTLRADGIQFRYPASRDDVLRDVSVEVSTGEVVALVGENGSGKSTLAKTLSGLLAPTSGSITWAGVPVGVDDDRWRARCAVVFQDFVRYMLSLRDNVAIAPDGGDADDETVLRSLQAVDLDALPSRLSGGLDTTLGPEFIGGTDLSGGQWQRLAIARALVRDAAVLILDEPSAALDPRAEASLFATLREVCEGRAVVVVSHRLATVVDADRIYVMQDGRIIEQGTHRDLLGHEGHYAELFFLQAQHYESRPPSINDPAVDRSR